MSQFSEKKLPSAGSKFSKSCFLENIFVEIGGQKNSKKIKKLVTQKIKYPNNFFIKEARYNFISQMELDKNFSLDILSHLPREIGQMIMVGLPIPEIMKICQLSREHQEICKDEYFWKILISRDFGAQSIGKRETPSSELYRMKASTKIVEKLIIDAFNVYMTWRRLPTEKERNENDPHDEQLRILLRTCRQFDPLICLIH